MKSLSSKQIVTGVSASEFNPGANVTRAEFTALLVRALGIEAGGQTTFSDVQAHAWYAPYVAAAVSQGIVSGRSSALFAPNAAISREEMAAMVIRALEVKQGQKVSQSSSSAGFADAASISPWAAVYVNTAAGLGLVQGRDGNQFAPKANMTRAESAQVIFKLLAK
ncbi:Endoglucanase precursor [compost metagenome]